MSEPTEPTVQQMSEAIAEKLLGWIVLSGEDDLPEKTDVPVYAEYGDGIWCKYVQVKGVWSWARWSCDTPDAADAILETLRARGIHIEIRWDELGWRVYLYGSNIAPQWFYWDNKLRLAVARAAYAAIGGAT